ncbi:MAG: hypothetical protein FWG64_01525 [Firmicutes bacterium]|nr:hypothetical protein [Bacillota bacterium]
MAWKWGLLGIGWWIGVGGFENSADLLKFWWVFCGILCNLYKDVLNV